MKGHVISNVSHTGFQYELNEALKQIEEVEKCKVVDTKYLCIWNDSRHCPQYTMVILYDKVIDHVLTEDPNDRHWALDLGIMDCNMGGLIGKVDKIDREVSD